MVDGQTGRAEGQGGQRRLDGAGITAVDDEQSTSAQRMYGAREGTLADARLADEV
jgi:hypothetical protein